MFKKNHVLDKEGFGSIALLIGIVVGVILITSVLLLMLYSSPSEQRFRFDEGDQESLKQLKFSGRLNLCKELILSTGLFRNFPKGYPAFSEKLALCKEFIFYKPSPPLPPPKLSEEQKRDNKRIDDMRNATLVLEVYYAQHGFYPAGTTPGTCTSNFTIVDNATATTHTSPHAGEYTYGYESANNNQNYIIRADLEDANHPFLNSDIDGANVLGCDCDDTNGYLCYTN